MSSSRIMKILNKQSMDSVVILILKTRQIWLKWFLKYKNPQFKYKKNHVNLIKESISLGKK